MNIYKLKIFKVLIIYNDNILFDTLKHYYIILCESKAQILTTIMMISFCMINVTDTIYKYRLQLYIFI